MIWVFEVEYMQYGSCAVEREPSVSVKTIVEDA